MTVPMSVIRSSMPSASCSAPVPIGVFWDIENCTVPFHKSALGLVQKIRDLFFNGCKEADFMCVCDTSHQNKDMIQELNDAQVTVVHISAISKNTADDKIRQSLRRFAADHKSPATIILISGDVNFASDLCDLRYRHQIHIILIHRRQVSCALTSCAHETHCFEDFISDLPTRKLPKTLKVVRELVVGNLPVGAGVQNSLQRLCKSVRGRILNIDGATALLRFPNNEAATRAKQLLDGGNVLGKKITVSYPGQEDTNNVSVGKKLNKLKNYANTPELFLVTYSDAKTGEKNLLSSTNSILYSEVDQLTGHDRLAADSRREVEEVFDNGVPDGVVPEEKLAVKLRGHSQSAEVLSGDIVIEEEQEGCAGSDEVSLDVGCALVVSDETAGRILNDIDSEVLASTKTSKREGDVTVELNKTEGRSKRRRKHSSKSISEEKSSGKSLENDKIKKPAPARNKCLTTPFVDLTSTKLTNSSALFASKNQYVKGGSELNGLQSISLCSLPSATDNKSSANSRFQFWSKDEAKFHLFPNQHLHQEFEAVQLCQSRMFANSAAPLDQLYTTYPSLCGSYESDAVVLHNGNNIKHANFVMTSTPWKSSPPDQSMLEGLSRSAGFRRTPGARRPIGIGKDGKELNSSTLCPKPLFLTTIDAGTSDISLIDGHQLSKCADLSGCEYLPPEKKLVCGVPAVAGVELVISNLDYNISTHEWKKILLAEFQQHIQVLKVNVQMLQDNTTVGFIRVPCLEDARYAISLFHRKKIGYKRIHVALVNNESASSVASIRAEVAGLLHEVAGNRLPLFKFIELFEKRFHRGISVSELYHMKDTVEITEMDGAGRMVILLPSPGDSMSSCSNDAKKLLESPVCRIHWCKDGPSFVDVMDMCNLPHVILQLRMFSAQVHKLLQSHDGSLPLVSFPSCFAAEFGEMEAVSEGGVPLEHLITCVPGVQLSLSEGGIKNIRWAENRPASPNNDGQWSNCGSPLIGQQMSQFSHEVIDLLKNSPQCRMPFSKFIPSYHHHFGRQCRVADYGYTKLLELFEAIPHVAQVIGNGSRRYITLTHRAQVKRFTVDIMRVLKSQASKQITALDLPIVYSKVIGRVFDINEYGVCFLEDMLNELPDSTFAVTGSGSELTIAMPKRDQTPEEMERMKQFALEVIDLLRHSPQCRMAFSKFIPAYHHHFGKQCRVADFGFTKLIELFEAIPNVVKILDEQDEKVLSLTEEELVHVLEDQVTTLLRSCPQNRIVVSDFHTAYVKLFGHTLRLNDFDVKSVVCLVKKIPAVAKVSVCDGGTFICLVDHSRIQMLARNVLLILMDLTEGSITVKSLVERYEQVFSNELDVNLLFELHGLIEVAVTGSETIVKLTPLQMFARDIRMLLLEVDGHHLQLNQFETNYSQRFGVALSPASYGFPTVVALLQSVPHVVALRGKGCRRTLILMQHFQEKLQNVSLCKSFGGTSTKDPKSDTPSSDSGCVDPRGDDEELIAVLQGHSVPIDLLSDPVPSCVPSPALHPQPQRPPSSLMHFDIVSRNPGQDFLMLTEEEKYGLCTPLCQTPVSDLLAFAAQLLPSGCGEEQIAKCKPLESVAKRSSTISLLQKEITLLSSEVADGGKFKTCCEVERNSLNDICAVTGEVVFSQSKDLKDSEMSNYHSDDKAIHTDSRVSECEETESNYYTTVSAEAKALSELPNQMQAVAIHSCSNNAEQSSPFSQKHGYISYCVTQASSDMTPSLSFESKNQNKSFAVQNSEMARRPESTRRSRIAARFDLSPNSSDSASCS